MAAPPSPRAVFLAHFGAALRAARQNRRLTLHQVGSMVGASASAVQRWESGLSSPDTFELVQLFGALGDAIAGVLGNMVDVQRRSGTKARK